MTARVRSHGIGHGGGMGGEKDEGVWTVCGGGIGGEEGDVTQTGHSDR